MPQVNLLPGWVKRQRVIDWRTVALVVTLIAATGAAGFQHFVVVQEIAAIRNSLELVDHEHSLLRPLLERRDALIAERQAIEQKQAFLTKVTARRWAPLLREVASLTPGNLQLNRVEMLEPDGLALTGSTPQLEPIAQLMTGIDRSPLLARAWAQYARDEEGRYNFEIRCRIR